MGTKKLCQELTKTPQENQQLKPKPGTKSSASATKLQTQKSFWSNTLLAHRWRDQDFSFFLFEDLGKARSPLFFNQVPLFYLPP